jgi:hypothetical protein
MNETIVHQAQLGFICLRYKATCLDLFAGHFQAYLCLSQLNTTPVGILSCCTAKLYCLISVAGLYWRWVGVCYQWADRTCNFVTYLNRGFCSGHPLSKFGSLVAFGVCFGTSVWCVAGGGCLLIVLLRVIYGESSLCVFSVVWWIVCLFFFF